MYIQTDIRLSD